ncbi:ABC transporter ATP-binding protein [Calderihabitans maritimus]|uniref:ABC transporter n=1 Tax=Calderihabitans maritimus TaxID=1246530 RepID=A0A1Z5HRG7_9FIRM|nr:ABC transporter ATP-binding protein [Calderihabitans maritimus]GAW91921.1 ABC transporter [Calderihabitans maritimus]
MALLEIQKLTKRFGGLVANREISMQIDEGEIVGLIGPNGAGKSTFFAMVAGFYQPDGGRIFFNGEDITGRSPEYICRKGITRTFQIVKPFEDMTVLENVMVGAFLRTASPTRARKEAEEVLEFTGLANKLDWEAKGLTIADKKRLELARALATKPKLLLLDEVMAGLTPTETLEAVELIRQIHKRGIALFIVEHVMEVVMPISHRVVVLDGGEKIAEGTPEEVAKDPRVIKSYLGEMDHVASG